ncbi:MAG: CopD family protein [Desulfobacterales bacterium]|nr:CopD family protein [Desulfobacterales bacterium]
MGGITFILFIVLPSAKQVLGVEAGKLMGEISKRFNPIANYSIILLIVTGAILTAFNKQYSGISNFDNNWLLGLIVKHVFVIGMVIVHFYRGLILTPKIAKTEADEKASLQKLSLNLVKTNFCLGLIVLLMSGIISILH